MSRIRKDRKEKKNETIREAKNKGRPLKADT